MLSNTSNYDKLKFVHFLEKSASLSKKNTLFIGKLTHRSHQCGILFGYWFCEGPWSPKPPHGFGCFGFGGKFIRIHRHQRTVQITPLNAVIPHADQVQALQDFPGPLKEKEEIIVRDYLNKKLKNIGLIAGPSY